MCYNIDTKKKCEGREVYREIELAGACYVELNTEIRFLIADARACGIELLRFALHDGDTTSRILNCAARVLRAMMRSELIQFFITDKELAGGSTEAEFLANKYGSLLNASLTGPALYVKI